MTTTQTAKPARKPFSIAVAAPAHAALSELVAHARNGYTVSDAPIELQPNGWMFFSVNLGDPVDYHIQKSKEAVAAALLMEEQERAKAIKEEARRIVEDEKKAALAKQVAAAVAEHEKAIAKLKQEAEAELARLK